MEFFLLLLLCHLALTATLLGVFHYTNPNKYLNFKLRFFLLVFILIVPILYFHSSRIQERIDNEGTMIKGIVVDKRYGSKGSPWLETKFIFNGQTYRSTLHISDRRKFKKVRLEDSVLIKFIEHHPKLNRTEKLLNQ